MVKRFFNYVYSNESFKDYYSISFLKENNKKILFLKENKRLDNNNNFLKKKDLFIYSENENLNNFLQVEKKNKIKDNKKEKKDSSDLFKDEFEIKKLNFLNNLIFLNLHTPAHNGVRSSKKRRL